MDLKKSCLFAARMSKSDMAALKKLAQRERLQPSEWLRAIIRRELQAVANQKLKAGAA